MGIKKLFFQAVKFGIVGFINTMINLGIVESSMYIFGEKALIPGNVIGFLVTIIIAFFIFIRFVFDASTQSKTRIFLKMFLAYGSTLLLSIGFQHVLLYEFAVQKYYVPLIALFLTVPINFVLNKLFVFKEKIVETKS